MIGTVTFNLEDIQNENHNNPRWFNLYGSKNIKTEFSNIMNQYPELGCTWKGRVLLAFKSFDHSKPRHGS
jgi:hypothetical protein